MLVLLKRTYLDRSEACSAAHTPKIVVTDSARCGATGC